MIVLPPNVGEAIGLGTMFQVTPFGFDVKRLELQTTDGPETLHVLRLIDTGGVRGYAFQSESFKTFAAQMVEASSGLLIPNNNQRNGNHERS